MKADDEATFEAALKKRCEYWDELVEVFGERASARPAFSSDRLYATSDDDDDDDDDGDSKQVLGQSPTLKRPSSNVAGLSASRKSKQIKTNLDKDMIISFLAGDERKPTAMLNMIQQRRKETTIMQSETLDETKRYNCAMEEMAKKASKIDPTKNMECFQQFQKLRTNHG